MLVCKSPKEVTIIVIMIKMISLNIRLSDNSIRRNYYTKWVRAKFTVVTRYFSWSRFNFKKYFARNKNRCSSYIKHIIILKGPEEVAKVYYLKSNYLYLSFIGIILRWGFLIWELIFIYCGLFVLILAQQIEALSLYGSRWALSEDSGFKSYPSRPEVYLVKKYIVRC